MSTSTLPPMKSQYEKNGFFLARNLLPNSSFDALEKRSLEIVNKFSGRVFESLQDNSFMEYIASDREAEQHLYAEIRKYSELQEISLLTPMQETVCTLLDKQDVVLLEKIPFRIDCPHVVRELAVWHQDHFYVQGDIETITAWIPLFDVPYETGCLMIMPGSHTEGPIPHDAHLLKKKFYPSSIFDRNVNYVEMKRGDVLFFHSCLLHSSGINLSDRIRFSIQSRYLGADAQSHPSMGERLELK